MEKKIKILYMLSIIAILAFLGMQAYWLYGRYEYTLMEFESSARSVIDRQLEQYDLLRAKGNPNDKDIITRRTVNNLNTDIDSLGNKSLTATVTTKIYNASKLLGIPGKRKLSKEEQSELAKLLLDSVFAIETRKAVFDASNAPCDGDVWTAIGKYELEQFSPFTIEGIDSLLRKENLEAEATLIVTDSMAWEASYSPHNSIFSQHFKMVIPYSILEKKAVVIDCRIPAKEVFRQMGWTLAGALVLSFFLILCLVWQIKTISKLTRLDKLRNMFLTTMIHELKRPVSTLKICVSGIENDRLMQDASWRDKMTSETRFALDNLSAYFSKLRDLTFNNVDEIPLNISSFDLAALVNDVYRFVAVPGTKQVALENAVPEGTVITADHSHLSNILTNLIENAIKYSGNEVAIKIRAEVSDSAVTIEISDNGNGIASADKSKIFNRFYRGRASSSEMPGMGLGLSYVKLLVEAHCGEIRVESEEGIGSQFIIILPQ